MTPFTWKNCWADVHVGFHDRTVQAYLTDVIEPAITALDSKIEELDASSEGWAPFAKADMEMLRGETLKAFALALQSLWERQLRDYVSGCAAELKLGEAVLADARASQWQRVERAFLAARGIELSAFPSHRTLAELHLLGNVCRHGDGPSVAKLHALRPDLWPVLSIALVDLTPEPPAAVAGLIQLTPDHLREFGSAIMRFWSDASYIYLESIESKHENVVAELDRLRVSRNWFPQAATTAS